MKAETKAAISFHGKRVGFDVIVVVILTALFFWKGEAQAVDLAQLKMLLISGGILHAHVSRKLLFPYIDFHTADTPHKIFLTVWYAIIVYGWSHGG